MRMPGSRDRSRRTASQEDCCPVLRLPSCLPHSPLPGHGLSRVEGGSLPASRRAFHPPRCCRPSPSLRTDGGVSRVLLATSSRDTQPQARSCKAREDTALRRTRPEGSGVAGLGRHRSSLNGKETDRRSCLWGGRRRRRPFMGSLPRFPSRLCFLNGVVAVDARREPHGTTAPGKVPAGCNGTEQPRIVRTEPMWIVHLVYAAELVNGHQSSSIPKRLCSEIASSQSLGRTVPLFMRIRVRGVATVTGISSNGIRWLSRSS